MQRLFTDTVGFAAAKTIRRIFGLAHNIDFELIEDPRKRAISEARAVRLARGMMVEAVAFRTIADVTGAARKLRDWQPESSGGRRRNTRARCASKQPHREARRRPAHQQTPEPWPRPRTPGSAVLPSTLMVTLYLPAADR